MDDLLPRFAAHLSDLGVTTGVGAALPVGPGVQSTTVRLTRGTSTRAYRLLYGQRCRWTMHAWHVASSRRGWCSRAS